MTQAMRDRDAAARNRARKSKYPKTLVRVRLPDGYLLQAAFMSDEPVQELYELVRFALNPAMDTADPLLPFRLVMPIPKTRDLDPTHNFYTANLAPAATVHLLLPAHTAWPGFQASVVGPPTTLPDASAELLLTSTRGELDEETARMDVDPPAAAYDDVESERRERAAAAALARTRGSGGGDDAKAGRPKWFTIGTK
ncbi:hypothetical protein BC828DRAFT_384952 [Blastocladiella britannica]|nr:hypothetical protein BC828DRAFT_384952 [Blastocladiella britannica]